MLGVSAHIADVTEIRTKVAEDITTGWITLAGRSDSLTMFFRNIEDIEKVIEALRALKHQFKVTLVRHIDKEN